MKIVRDFLSVFNISTFERRAAIALLFILSLFALKKTYRYYVVHPAQEVDSAKLAAFFEMVRLNNSELSSAATSAIRPFDPNTDSYDSLIAKGVPSQLASNMIAYREKVTTFKAKSDLKKLYKMTDSDFDMLQDYIIINQHIPSKPKTEEKILSRIEINNASLRDFSSLKGIGPVLSKRIIAYRNLLGGFANIAQLAEVYGISDSLYATFSYQLSCDKDLITKININQADFRSLLRHPYIDKAKVKTLLNYREEVKEISNLNELYLLEGFDTVYVQRIIPYLQLRE